MCVSTVQCIGEAFGVNPSDDAQRQKLTIKPATLQSLFDVYLKTKEKVATPKVFCIITSNRNISLSSCETTGTPGTSSGASKATTGAPSNSSTPSATDKSQAEQLKLKGNAMMTSKDYAGAIAAYTSAIALDPINPVYYSNRAAAHSSSNNHEGAVKDAEKAIEVDSSFVKAYHRLGSASPLTTIVILIPNYRHAFYCLGDYQGATDAFQRGLDLDPSNASLKSGRDNAKTRIPSTSTSESTQSTPAGGDGGGPNFNDVLRSLGGGGGEGGAGGGGFDLASMMQNPMFMNMAQQLMQNGGLENLMGNPAVNNMVKCPCEP
jgi:small glutamine-rich tetratricopeptide repeat-containing protein alpha